ncbi:MAG TPA: hypothetical protein VD735_03480 [Candidatus Saccharimonadales bacterium]|nr:hypothetical protein [Candidatus Saccharimonadales bacterium]
MLQRYEVVPIPVAETPEAARDLLQQFVSTALPAVVVRNATTESVHGALAQLGEDLPAGMQTEAHTCDFEFGNAGQLGAIGMHHDHLPPVEGEEEIAVTYHLTHSGLAVASLLAPGAGLVERVRSMEKPRWLGEDVDAHFDKGLVDTDVTQPVCHQTVLTAGSLLVFKNGLSYWHRMQTEGEGRRSTAYDSIMAVQPGMNVQFQGVENPLQSL